MLQPPRSHVRQRSIGKYEEGKKDVQAEEPLLDEAEYSSPLARQSPRYITLGALWAASLILTALCTYLFTSSRASNALGSFGDGYDTNLGR